MKLRQAKRQRDKVAGDGTYWTGGQCQWGGSHNLNEDCETLANFFKRIDNLKTAKSELIRSATDKNSFENKKRQLNQEADQLIAGLQAKTSNSSSIGGICIIWSDFASFLEDKLNDFKKALNNFKEDLNRREYNEAKDLRKLESEERKIKKDIEDGLKKARNEPDEQKKKKILLLVDEDKKKLEKLYEKKKNIALSSVRRWS